MSPMAEATPYSEANQACATIRCDLLFMPPESSATQIASFFRKQQFSGPFYLRGTLAVADGYQLK
jgi:hypothetical protein